ncbi:MAG: transcription-repair coupling factor [Planctomycetes bacterium]|nr:transcription-repair coupling factor [Planctomycetota bacterium]
MRAFLQRIAESAPFRCLAEGVRAAGGLRGPARAAVLAGLLGRTPRPALAVTPEADTTEGLLLDLAALSPGLPAASFPALQGADPAPLAARLAVLDRLEAGEPLLVVAEATAVVQGVPSAREAARRTLPLAVGASWAPDVLAARLVEAGFAPVPMVQAPGELARRGGILDVFPLSRGEPLRIEFVGDRVDSLRSFDPESQRSSATLTAAPIPLYRDPTEAPEEPVSLAARLPEGSATFLVEALECARRAEEHSGRHPGARPWPEVVRRLEALGVTRLDGLPSPEEGAADFETLDTLPMGGETGRVLEELDRLVVDHDVLVACATPGERDRLAALVAEHGLTPRVRVVQAAISGGVRLPGLGLALLSSRQLLARGGPRRAARRALERPGRAIDSFLELSPGERVVHLAHGIGRFRGIVRFEKKGRLQEFLAVEFRDEVTLHVPVSRIDLVQRYVGAGGATPPLSRLGGTSWAAKKDEVRQAVEDLAAELLEVQAARAASPGIAFPEDPLWQHQFEAAFPYEETPDQDRAAEAIRADMQAERPMDRLVCGDVGYGKTELAMRAAFRAVLAGKQVAVLVPTTVLADQHLRTFRERMAAWPATVDMVSRFRTRGEVVRVLEATAAGRVDVLIGTHRLLSGDVVFRDLGLVVIDEEQRFGVAHKERLKRLRRTVDVLTLTATPIPRTLHMSLLGVRDISSLETPPLDRRAIETRVVRASAALVGEAIERELERGGQCYFVHNRVHSIHRVARRIAATVPSARVTVVHGQMPEREVEARMAGFVAGEADVLVTTAIIESGLDIPNANTIFIDRAAEHFGLADLHQLRGRVGRYRHRAYCYLLVPPDETLSPEGEKRLRAIEEYQELGAGFRIAMRDLEIRGAGNILGPQQSGHIASVGYDLYCRLLREAAERLRSGAAAGPVPEADSEVDLEVSAFLPEGHVPEVRQRLDLYRRLRASATRGELDEVAREMRDRFGEPPPEATALLDLHRVRVELSRLGVRRAWLTDEGLRLVCRDLDGARRALAGGRASARALDAQTLYIPLGPRADPRTALAVLREQLSTAQT